MLFLFLATTLVATALPSSWTPPVELVNCRMIMMAMTMDKPSPATPQNAGVEVTLVNHAPTVATNFVLRVTENGRSDQIESHGKYSPKVKITVRFTNFAGTDYFREEPDECKLMSIKFSDGSTWTAPESQAN